MSLKGKKVNKMPRKTREKHEKHKTTTGAIFLRHPAAGCAFVGCPSDQKCSPVAIYTHSYYFYINIYRQNWLCSKINSFPFVGDYHLSCLSGRHKGQTFRNVWNQTFSFYKTEKDTKLVLSYYSSLAGIPFFVLCGPQVSSQQQALCASIHWAIFNKPGLSEWSRCETRMTGDKSGR
jgi:hypothetical protein